MSPRKRDAARGGAAVQKGGRAFDPAAVTRFRFVGHELDPSHGRGPLLHLRYALDLEDASVELCEELVFEGGVLPEGAAERDCFDRAARLLHWIAGISYYKAAVPPEIVVENGPVSPRCARFLERLYLLGLGEFAFQNGLDLRDRIRFPKGGEVEPPAPPAPRLRRRTAVPVGGGKDSIVTIEALKRAGEPILLFSLGRPDPIRDVARVAAAEHVVVTRRISSELLELNRRGALNGHVPFSAILASILTVSSLLYGFDAAALSNERSADEGNVAWNDLEVNHQYSKTSAFERDFDALVRAEILPSFTYFSFLRPFSELAISAAFSRTDSAYREAFVSCNAALRLDPGRRARRWCGDCPKCRFVFLALAPFLPKGELVRVFGANLLDDERQGAGYAELLGLDAHKPFECVGELDECVAAFAWCAQSSAWREDALVRRFRAHLPEGESARRMLEEALRPAEAATLPERYRAMLPGVPAVLRG